MPVEDSELKKLGPRPATTRFVITEKVPDDSSLPRKFKTRLVARGFLDQTIGDADSDSPSAGKDIFRTLLAIAANKGHGVHVADAPTAFLRAGVERLSRNVYLKPPPNFSELMPKEIK